MNIRLIVALIIVVVLYCTTSSSGSHQHAAPRAHGMAERRSRLNVNRDHAGDTTQNSNYAVPPANLAPAPYAEWAHYHWVWLNSFIQNGSSIIDLVQGYLERDVPVGCVDIDSAWSTGFNNFVWNTDKFPNPQQLIDDLHALNVKVILWVTSMVNVDSSNYQYGLENKYFLNGGKTVKWWHGRGSFIDYFNPDALAWWHSQMDNVLDMGIDGWKCDGTDPYILELGVPESYKGIIDEREYADAYYGDFFNYTRSKRGMDGLIMSRPVDSPAEYLYLRYSPRYTVFSGWVGDQQANFEGMQKALRNMFHSAWDKYVNFGSDIGGYITSEPGPLGRSKELFIRWFQLGAFLPLMENGGNGEHRPWMFDNTNETLDIYRDFVNFHMELVPFFLTAGTEAYEQGESVMQPLADWTIFTPSTWDYILWNDIFVSPMVEDNNATTKTIKFPPQSDWVDWWSTNEIYPGGSTITDYVVPWNRFPVFTRKGSMIPLRVTRSDSIHCYQGKHRQQQQQQHQQRQHMEEEEEDDDDASSNNNINNNNRKKKKKKLCGSLRSAQDNAITLLIHSPTPTTTTTTGNQRRSLREDPAHNKGGMHFEYAFDSEARSFKFTATAHENLPLVLLLRGVHLDLDSIAVRDFVHGVNMDRVDLFESLGGGAGGTDAAFGAAWFADPDQNEMWVRIDDTSEGVLLEIQGIASLV